MAARLLAADPDVDFLGRCRNTVIARDTDVGTLVVEVGNAGSADATSDVEVVLVSPFYVNFDDLPPGVEYLVNNESPDIPEMIRFAVAAGELASRTWAPSFSVGLKRVGNGPRLFDPVAAYLRAVSGTETNLHNNNAVGAVTLDGAVPPLRTRPADANPVNYYFTYEQPRLDIGQKADLTVRVGNAGSKDTPPVADALFTFVTPYNVKVDRTNTVFQSRGPVYHSPDDPNVPDIVSVPVTKADLTPDPDLQVAVGDLPSLTIPLESHGGGYANRGGKGFLAAGPGDFDDNITVAIGRLTIIQT